MLLFQTEGEYTYTTTSQYNFNRHWIFTRRQYITFSVQSCTSAIVLLAETPGTTETRYYEIIIGNVDNTKVSIFDSDNAGDIYDLQVEELLNCDEFRQFWISWTFNNGTLVGKRIDILLRPFDNCHHFRRPCP